MDAFLLAVEQSAIAGALRTSFVVYPLVNAGHIMAIGVTFATVMLIDLRVLGLFAGVPLERVLRPVALTAFGFAVASGLALFSVQARDYAANPAFLAKLALIAVAGANLAAFRLVGAGRSTLPQRLSAALSLALWTGAVVAGRFIGFL